MTTLTHQEAARLMRDHPGSWGLGVSDARRHLKEGVALTRELALYRADLSTLDAFRAYWGGYAAAIVRYGN